MIFLIPILIIIAVLFGVDYLYFHDENAKITHEDTAKIEQKALQQDKAVNDYLNRFIKK